ncbi:Ethanolamine kinase [Binucleata daphniae]
MEIHNLENVKNLNTILQSYKKGEWIVKPFTKGNTNTTAMLVYKKSHICNTRILNCSNNNIDGNVNSDATVDISNDAILQCNSSDATPHYNIYSNNLNKTQNSKSTHKNKCVENEKITNVTTSKFCLLKCDVKDINCYEKYIIRIYGCEGLIDRKKEIENCLLLAKYNLAPMIRLQFNYGIIQDYIEGVDLNVTDMESEMKNIAIKMREWHSIKLTNNNPILFTIIEKWYEMAQKNHCDLLQEYKIKEKILKYKNLVDNRFRINTNNEVANIGRNDLRKYDNTCISSNGNISAYDNAIDKNNNTNDNTYKKLTSTEAYKKESVGFCHNDLLASNIIKLSSGAVYFIDYEYSGCNFVAFDIANHFAEYAGYDFVVEKIPVRNNIIEFLGYYGDTRIIDDILFFMPLTHLLWGLWALLRDGDFDYHKYAIQRIEEFVKTAQ